MQGALLVLGKVDELSGVLAHRHQSWLGFLWAVEEEEREMFDSWVHVVISPAFLFGLSLLVLNHELFLLSPQNGEGGTLQVPVSVMGSSLYPGALERWVSPSLGEGQD